MVCDLDLTFSDNIEYRQGVAEEIASVPDNSVDLLTCAQTAHWLQLEPFYKQLNRVLKPGTGTCAQFLCSILFEGHLRLCFILYRLLKLLHTHTQVVVLPYGVIAFAIFPTQKQTNF